MYYRADNTTERRHPSLPKDYKGIKEELPANQTTNLPTKYTGPLYRSSLTLPAATRTELVERRTQILYVA